jgi:hypothetical protein
MDMRGREGKGDEETRRAVSSEQGRAGVSRGIPKITGYQIATELLQ